MKIGKRVRFRLYIGREVDGVIRRILKETTGTKLVVEYGKGNYVAKIRPDQLIPPPGKNSVPDDVNL